MLWLYSGGMLSIQVNDSGGVHSVGEGTVAYSQRFHTDHEDGAGKVIFLQLMTVCISSHFLTLLLMFVRPIIEH